MRLFRSGLDLTFIDKSLSFLEKVNACNLLYFAVTIIFKKYNMKLSQAANRLQATLLSNKTFLGSFMLLFFLMTACKTVDIRTDYALKNNTESDVQKGKDLLQKAYTDMGYDKLQTVNTYQANTVFKWRMPWTLMPFNSFPGNKGKEVQFRFNTNTFDGQVGYLEGRKKGKVYGLQAWQGYLKESGKPAKKKKGKRHNWGLSAYHYLIEGPMRLLGADIIRYAGEKTFNGQQYDLVYATWGQDAPHKEHDQWLVYINKATGMIDLTELTINDFFLPTPPAMKKGTVLFNRSLAANGTYLPDLVTVQLGKPKKPKKHVYAFTLKDYQFDNFEESILYPLDGLEKVGDEKKIKQ